MVHHFHLVDWTHAVDRQMLARLNAAIVFGVIATGLASCVFGAAIYDVGRWFSVW
jgi:hypothetical protein